MDVEEVSRHSGKQERETTTALSARHACFNAFSAQEPFSNMVRYSDLSQFEQTESFYANVPSGVP